MRSCREIIMKAVQLHIFALVFIQSAGLQAGQFSSTVIDSKGNPVPDAVLSLVPSKAVPVNTVQEARMEQLGKQFLPHVLPVLVGTVVSFPNRDSIKHHVYSFSPSKRFQIKLYGGDAAEPVTFDKPGVVALGCNIHDFMLGYIYVVDTPFFAKTNAHGRVEMTKIPSGHYTVTLWHPRLKGNPDGQGQTVVLNTDSKVETHFQLKLKRARRRDPRADEYSDN